MKDKKFEKGDFVSFKVNVPEAGFEKGDIVKILWSSSMAVIFEGDPSHFWNADIFDLYYDFAESRFI